MESNYLRDLDTESRRQGLEISFVRAIVLKESSGNQWATRYEPGFRYLEHPEYWANHLGQTEETETIQQKCSYGLMQIMGGTARGLGFSGMLSELYIPSVNIHYGCLLLSQKLRRYGDYPSAISAYNAGTATLIGIKFANQDYVDSVLKIKVNLAHSDPA
jgi:hypothetical protein